MRAAVCVPLVAATLLASGCTKSENLATVADESEAIEIVSVLSENGIDAEKQETGEEGAKQWKITVADSVFGPSKLPAAFRVLRDRGLPRNSEKGMEGAYDEKGMFPSDSAQRAQRLKELKTEIERQLRLLPAVVRVRVNVVMPEDDSLNLNPYPAAASVLIISETVDPLFSEEHVRGLVTKSVPKLKPENVNVVIIHEPHPEQLAEFPRRRSPAVTYTIVALIAMLTCVLALTLVWRRRHGTVAANAAEPVIKVPDQTNLPERVLLTKPNLPNRDTALGRDLRPEPPVQELAVAKLDAYLGQS